MFDAVLIANRGEIAVRVARGCRELGVRTVAVYSDGDRDALHVRMADEAYLLGAAAPAESYLHVGRIVETALRAGVDAVHPGYGFLSENAAFAQAVQEAGLTFVGPSPDAIERMGDKLSARAVATAAGVPVVPGTAEPTDDPAVARAFGEAHGYPVAVKAMFGGGGRGLKVVRDAEGMVEALASARREAAASFGRGECYLERYLPRPRHVEVQVLADLDGTTIHLGDRDCSLQRRHQKLVEEAPAPGLADAVRAALGAAAVRIAREMGYTNAGTCEFLLDEDGRSFSFLEMNTRLQVEHPVTELVTGVDLVHAQLRIAAGDGLGLRQEDVRTTGHAIEVRINAEDPAVGFRPAPGRVETLEPPLGPWVRFDTGVTSGSAVPADYDNLVGKLSVWGGDREVARARMCQALDELRLTGVPTTVPFHRLAMRHPDFVAATHATTSVEEDWDLSSLAGGTPPGEAGGATSGPDTRPVALTVEVDGRRFEIAVHGADQLRPVGGDTAAPPPRRRRGEGRRHGPSGDEAALPAPMQGTVVRCAVQEGEQVTTGQLVVVLEAMKMENGITAHRDGVVRALVASAGQVVRAGDILLRIERPTNG